MKNRFNQQNPSQFSSRRRKSGKKTTLVILGVILFLGLAAVGAACAWYFSSISGDGACGEDEVYLTINSNDSVDAISSGLERQGIIKNALAFKIYLRINNKATSLKTGTYTFCNGTHSSADVADVLSHGVEKATFRVTFLPGDTLYKIKQKLMDLGYTESAVEAAFAADYSDIDLVKNHKPADASLEGLIYGETYEFYADASAEDIIRRAITQLQTVIKEEGLEAKYQARDLTLYEGLILASIVEKEAYKADMPGVAQVFELRLKKGMSLGSDVTVAYAADLINPNRDKTDMSVLNIDSPYNTRKYTGLPPTPIASPGIEALRAVADPADGDYLFFLTGDDGTMYYSHTDAEHRRKAELYCKVLCSII
jgi:UPF0755 protein